ncbi:MAG: hypothetical protein ACD_4C00233G0001, partial [uncultured bacterium (gcode 4)]
METKTKIPKALFGMIMLFMCYNSFAFEISSDNPDASVNDTWSFNWNYTLYKNPTDSIPDGHLRTISWSISSTLYWDFISNDLKAFLKKDDTRCGTNYYTLTLSWTAHSEFWWNYNFDWVNSFTCTPKWTSSSDIKINLQLPSNSKLWEKFIWKDLISESLATTINENLKILWSQKLNVWKLVSYEENVNDPRYIMKTNINVQMADLLKWKSHNNDINSSSQGNVIRQDTLDSNKILYYNYIDEAVSIASSEDNKWKILTLQTNSPVFSDDPDNYKLKITWQRTIIVKWWNVYINADIYNKTDNPNDPDASLLVIIAKRDPNNLKNWWNIYINPNVT